LKWVMQFLVQASQTTFTDMDAENQEYLNVLRESVLEAYTGILTGMGSEGKANSLTVYLEPVFAFLEVVAKDTERSDDVTKAAVGVIGDLAHQMGSQVAQWLSHPSIRRLVQDAATSREEALKKAAQWAIKSASALAPTASATART